MSNYLLLQSLILLPQQLVLLLQHFILLAQARIVDQYLIQLLLQLHKLISIPSRHDGHQFTIHTAFLTRAFQPVFSKTSTFYKIMFLQGKHARLLITPHKDVGNRSVMWICFPQNCS